jgi:hypothetical protein
MQAVASITERGSPIADAANWGLGGIPVPVNTGWQQMLRSVSGLDTEGLGADDEASILVASSPHMRITLLRYRVSKKLLLWETFVGLMSTLQNTTPSSKAGLGSSS